MTPTTQSEITYRKLGRTGVSVSSIGLGGSHIGKAKLSSREAVRLMQAALDRGMNFMDNSWDYNEGESEKRMGQALKGAYRDKAFVMTKVDGRTMASATSQIETSLKRLQVDQIDLLQHHEIIRYEDVDRIFAEGGAMEAFLKARDEGKIRFIGFTGHKHPSVHLHMLETAERMGFQFDTVQMPLNVFDAHYRSFQQRVLPELVLKGIGVLGMKSMGGGVFLKSHVVTPIECLHYALNLPTSVVITGIDSMEILDQAFEAASTFQPISDKDVTALLKKTAEAAKFGQFELFKTSSLFDSTAEHPEWLGEELERTQALAGD